MWNIRWIFLDPCLSDVAQPVEGIPETKWTIDYSICSK